jgi:beta-N-acetylhexosaminidase
VYRRRRAVALGVLAALVAGIVLGIRALSGGPSKSGGIDVSAVSTERLIGQRLMVRMTGSATPTLVRAARKGEIGGVILFPPTGQNGGKLAEQVTRLRKAAREGGNPPLLVAIDQEGGPIKRLPDGPPESSPAQLGEKGDEAAAEDEGVATGRYLARTANVDLAPVLDVPRSPDSILGDRTYGTDPAVVATIGTAFARGLRNGGVAATAKHFPGLGAAPTNTDLGTSVVTESKRDLEDDLEPFRVAIAAGVQLVMISNATYPAYGTTGPAAFSPQVVGDLLRGELDFGGVVISDDLEAGAVNASKPPPEAAVSAARAGVDVLLFARGNPSSQVTPELLRAARKGTLTRPALEDAYRRIVTLKQSLSG